MDYTKKSIDNLVEIFFNKETTKKQKEDIMIYLMKNNKYDIWSKKAKKIGKNHNKNYYYLITFTKREDILIEDESIEQYIIKQFQRKPLQITEAHIVKEKTKKGQSHWHVSVSAKKCLKKDRFNYYIKKYGYIDISKSRHNSLEEGINYINKVSQSKQIT